MIHGLHTLSTLSIRARSMLRSMLAACRSATPLHPTRRRQHRPDCGNHRNEAFERMDSTSSGARRAIPGTQAKPGTQGTTRRAHAMGFSIFSLFFQCGETFDSEISHVTVTGWLAPSAQRRVRQAAQPRKTTHLTPNNLDKKSKRRFHENKSTFYHSFPEPPPSPAPPPP